MATKTQHHTTPVANDLAVFTLVVWLLCTSLGALGLLLPYARPRPPAPPDEPVIAQSLPVELTAQPAPPPDLPPPSVDPLAPPPLPPPPDAMTPPPVTPAIAVAQPNPAIAFALPVEGPTRVVEVKRAEYVRPAVTNTSVVTAAPPASAPPAQTLTFGEGEGRQPAPEYPRLSARQGQEGVVLIRLTVGLDGGVMSAEVARASPWPLLNQAALKVVRDRWRFRGGPVRTYEVSIRFELAK